MSQGAPTGVSEASWDPIHTGVSPEAFRHTMSHVAAGVVVVTAHRDGLAHAMTATAFCSVSLDPPLVLVSVSRTSRFHAVVTTAGSWAVSVLRADQADLARHFSRSGRDLRTQFDTVAHLPAPVSGAPLITGSLVWMDCHTEAVHPASDHTIVVGRVLATGIDVGLDAAPDPARLLGPGISSELGSEPGGAVGDDGPQPLTYYRSRYRS